MTERERERERSDRGELAAGSKDVAAARGGDGTTSPSYDDRGGKRGLCRASCENSTPSLCSGTGGSTLTHTNKHANTQKHTKHTKTHTTHKSIKNTRNTQKHTTHTKTHKNHYIRKNTQNM